MWWGQPDFLMDKPRRWNIYYSVSFQNFRLTCWIVFHPPVWDIGCEQRTPGVEQQPFGIPRQERLKEAEAKTLALQKRCWTVGRRNSCWSPTSMAVSKIAKVHFKSFPLQHVGVELLCFWLRYTYYSYLFVWIAAQRSCETKWMKQKFSAKASEFLNVYHHAMIWTSRHKVNDPLVSG